MPPSNPYNFNLPARHGMFFGRQRDIQDLLRTITEGDGDSIAIIGGRRIGKTSLLAALKNRLSQPVGDLLVVPILIDLTRQEISSVADFFHMMEDEIEDALGAYMIDEPDCSPARRRPQAPAPAFTRHLEEWEGMVMKKTGYRLRVVVLFDEWEYISELTEIRKLYAALRSVITGPSTTSSFKALLVGSQGFFTQINQRGSPIYNVLRCHRLSVLDDMEAVDLIVKPTGDVLHEDVVRRVIDQSGAHPFLAQYLLYYLWQKGLDTVTTADVDRIAENFHHERPDFQHWIDGLGNDAIHVYQTISRYKGSVDEGTIEENFPPKKIEMLPQVLDGLCYHGLVAEEPSGYRITALMFKDWLMKYRLVDNRRMSAGNALDSAVVEILSARGEILGTGFVVSSDGLLVTCAHVVLAAGNKVGGKVKIAFRATGKEGEADILPKGWYEDQDVAFLKAGNTLSRGIHPVSLRTLKQYTNQRIQAFGYPSLGEMKGLWADGVVVGKHTDAKSERLQLRSTQITRGFSGGPVAIAETGHVIGMLVSVLPEDALGRNGETALAVSSQTLFELSPVRLEMTTYDD